MKKTIIIKRHHYTCGLFLLYLQDRWIKSLSTIKTNVESVSFFPSISFTSKLFQTENISPQQFLKSTWAMIKKGTTLSKHQQKNDGTKIHTFEDHLTNMLIFSIEEVRGHSSYQTPCLLSLCQFSVSILTAVLTLGECLTCSVGLLEKYHRCQGMLKSSRFLTRMNSKGTV